jgi:hypothetical protein
MSTEIAGRYGQKTTLLVVRETHNRDIIEQYIRSIDLLSLLCAGQVEFMDARAVLKTLSLVFCYFKTPSLISQVTSSCLPDDIGVEELYFDRMAAILFFNKFYVFARKLARLSVLAVTSHDPFSVLAAEKEIYESLVLLQNFKAVQNPLEGVYEMMGVGVFYRSVKTKVALADMGVSVPLAAYLCECKMASDNMRRNYNVEDKQQKLIEEEEAAAAAAAQKKKKKNAGGRRGGGRKAGK